MVDLYTFSPNNLTVQPILTTTTILGNDNEFPADLPNPSFGLTKSQSYRVLKANFGDGYSQRSADGLNTEQETFDPTWNNMTYTQYQRLSSYLATRKGFRAFLWQSPMDGEQKPYICESFSTTIVSYRVYTVSAKFTRVYDLL